jgi:hypothetical protein
VPADKAGCKKGGAGPLGKIYNEHLVGYCRMSKDDDVDDFEDDDFEDDDDAGDDDEGDE